MPEEMMEAAASPAEEILATPWLKKKRFCLMANDQTGRRFQPAVRRERRKKRRSKRKKKKRPQHQEKGRKEAEGTTNRRRKPAKISLLDEPSHVHQVD